MKRLCYVLDVYLYNNLPRLHEHLKRLDIGSEVYAASWFITLFAEQLSLSILSKLWVLFILKGWKMLIKFSIAVLCAFET